jgi:hypothetical protein
MAMNYRWVRNWNNGNLYLRRDPKFTVGTILHRRNGTFSWLAGIAPRPEAEIERFASEAEAIQGLFSALHLEPSEVRELSATPPMRREQWESY